MDIKDLTIKICRHATSKQNSGSLTAMEFGDFRIPLAEGAKQDAIRVGRDNAEFLRAPGTLIYQSPYLRVRQTMSGILSGAGLVTASGDSIVRVYEDPRLREVEHGYRSVEEQESLRQLHGWFYYRYEGGESPADCYDRCATFIENLLDHVRRKDGVRQVFICTHGLTARLLVMRFLYLNVEQFESMKNPDNCDVITIAPRGQIADPQFVSRRWAVSGLQLYPELDASRQESVRHY